MSSCTATVAAAAAATTTTEEGGNSVHAFLPGFRFYPTEEVLVSYYLRHKIEGKDSLFSHIIPVIDVCKYEPSDLPAFCRESDSPDHETEWFFFSQPECKYINSTRCNRTTHQGFYKITGKERDIKSRRSKAVIGKKRTLTFYEGRVPEHKRTSWGLTEYYLIKPEGEKGPYSNKHMDFVLCRLKNKSANYKKLNDDSICDELADSGTGGCIASNAEDDQAGPTDVISDQVDHLAHKEPGDVMNGNGHYHIESPNGSCLMDNVNNDISTCDYEETSDLDISGFDIQAEYNLSQEQLSAVLGVGVNLDSPFPPHQPPSPPQPPQPQLLQPSQPPQPQDYCSSKLQSSSYTKLVNVSSAYNDDCSKHENYYLTHKNNSSNNYHNEPFSNTAVSVQNRVADETISEAYFQPEEDLRFLFQPFDLQDYTLMSPMNTGLGDLCMPI